MNTNHLQLLLLTVLVYSLSAPMICHSATPTGTPTGTPAQADAQATLEHARQLYEKSESLGFAWRAAKEHLLLAQTEFESGNYNQAHQAATEAAALAEASIAQAEREATAWRKRIPFNTGN